MYKNKMFLTCLTYFKGTQNEMQVWKDVKTST